MTVKRKVTLKTLDQKMERQGFARPTLDRLDGGIAPQRYVPSLVKEMVRLGYSEVQLIHYSALTEDEQRKIFDEPWDPKLENYIIYLKR